MSRTRRGHPTNPISIRLSSCMRSCSVWSCARSFTPTWCAAASAEEPDCSDVVPAKPVADQAGLPSGRNNPKVGTIGVVPMSEQRRLGARRARRGTLHGDSRVGPSSANVPARSARAGRRIAGTICRRDGAAARPVLVRAGHAVGDVDPLRRDAERGEGVTLWGEIPVHRWRRGRIRV